MKHYDDIYPLTSMQQLMLLRLLAGGDAKALKEIARFTLRGEMDVRLYQRAWQAVIDRHPILRTAFLTEGLKQPLQVVRREAQPEWTVEDWRDLEPDAQTSALQSFLEEDQRRGFDPAQAPLMRFALMRVSDDRYELLQSFHHMLMDRWSGTQVMKEVMRLYEGWRRGEEVSLPPARPFRDYVRWLQDQDPAEAEAYWKQTLAGFKRPTPLPLSRSDGGGLAREAGEIELRRIELSAESTATLRAWSRKRRVTLNTMVSGAWAVVLSQASAEDDVVFGVTMSGRPADLDGVEEIVGQFVNNLPVRIRVDGGAEAGAWLRGVQAEHTRSRRFQHTPLALVQELSEVSVRQPLFESLYVFQNPMRDAAPDDTAAARRPSLEIVDTWGEMRAGYPLTLVAYPGARLTLQLSYDPARFDIATIDALLGDLRSVLEGLVGVPEVTLDSLRAPLRAAPAQSGGREELNTAVPVESRDPAARDYVAPRTETERVIAEVWSDMLGIDRLGVCDNFFDLGGTSLRLLRVHSKLVEELGFDLSITEMFQYSTIDALAERLGGGSAPEKSLQFGAASRVRRRRSEIGDDIAVVGMAGRFPDAPDVETFWANLRDGVESIRVFTDEELRESGVSDKLLQRPSYVKAGTVLEDADLFDARFFHCTPREAELIDPQQRVFLECAWEALERAGYDPERYTGMIGVYGGNSGNSYLENLRSRPDVLAAADELQIAMGSGKDFLATRVSYKLNLRGPSMTVQAACSTSLVAVHEACRTLVDHQCDLALAGGASIIFPQISGYLHAEGGILSPDGHCRAFDSRARGMVFGNGVGVVVLKRLDEAVRDGDEIHAVIRGSAINNDGSDKIGYTAPSMQGQAEVIALAQAVAGVDPETIGYVEAHGTGTPLGDPIEVAALTKAFSERTDEKSFCGLGSVKSNMGHLDVAAGVAGLIKTVLALEHRTIPPSLNFEEPNPEIDFENSPFYVVTECRDWEAEDGKPRRAGVSSFGAGGTNVHAVLEEAPPMEPSGPSREWQLLVLSAKSRAALDVATSNLAAWLRDHDDANLADVAHTLQVGRREFEHRRAVVCRSAAEAVEALEGSSPDGSWTMHAPSKERRVVFLFPGQGAQYVNMGLDLYDAEPAFREAVDECLSILEANTGLDLRPVLYPEGGVSEEASECLTRTAVTQPALFVVEYALSRLWRSWGIEPEACIGHSIGEYVAACVSGVLSLEDALRLVVERGRLMESMPEGVMLAVPLAEDRVAELLSGEDGLWLSTVNAPSMCVVSATADRVSSFEARLAGEGVECRRLHTSHAFHSGLMDDAVGPFVEAVRGVTPHAPEVPYLSNVTGDWVTADLVQDPSYWGRQIREAVRFSDGMERLLSDPNRVLLEVGPGQGLGSLAKLHPDCGRDRVVVSSLRQPRTEVSDIAFLTGALGRLWAGGVRVDWSRLRDGERRRRVTMPTYPFQRERFWIERRREAAVPPLAGRRPDIADWFYAPVWRRTRIEKPDTQGADRPARSEAASEAKPTSILIFANAVDFDRRVVERLEETGRSVAIVRAGGSFRETDGAYEIDPSVGEDYVRLVHRLRDSLGVPREIVHLWSASFEPQRPTDRCAEEIQTRGLQSLLHLARALGVSEITDPLRITVVTDGVHGVSGDEAIQPEKATVLGFCRTAPLEMPNLSCRNVDLSIDAGAEQTEPVQRDVDRLVDELLSAADDPMVAIRRGHRWVQSFVHTGLDAVAKGGPRRLRPQGTYLITGGLGGMGLAVAGYLARSVKAKLVLVGRTALPERRIWTQHVATHGDDDPLSRRIRGVEAMEAAGAEVLVAHADVCDHDQMKAVVSGAVERFGRIDGVFHCAGIAGGGVILRLESAHAAEVLAPKVTGTRVLERLFAKRKLDFMVLFSSLITACSRPGRVDYCAANAYLDAFARRFAADTGTFTVAIDWTTWGEVGMAVDTARRRGWDGAIEGITNAEGTEVLRRVLDRSDEAQVLVSEVDLRELFAPSTAAKAAAEHDATDPAADALHGRPELSTSYVAPRSDTERTLARIWESLLGIERIGVHDSFYELGGDSVLGIQIVARTNDAGIRMTLNDLLEDQTIAELASVVGSGEEIDAEQGPVTGDVPLTPIQHWFFERELIEPSHYNQARLFSVNRHVTPFVCEQALRHLLDHHDALRMRFHRVDGGWRQEIGDPGDDVAFTHVDLSDLPAAEQAQAITNRSGEVQASLDLTDGPLLRATWFELGPDRPNRLLVVIHQLVMDGVSWSVLREDLQHACEQLGRGREVQLPPKTTSFRRWSHRLADHVQSPIVTDQLDYWLNLPWENVVDLPLDRDATANTAGVSEKLAVALSEEDTRSLLQDVPKVYNTQINDVLLTALLQSFARWTGRYTLLVDLERDGREDLFENVNLSRTVGWFTSLVPVVLDVSGIRDADSNPGAVLKEVKEQVRAIPDRGVGHGFLRRLNAERAVAEHLHRLPRAQIIFHYVEQPDPTYHDEPMFGAGREPVGPVVSPRNQRSHLIEVGGNVLDGRLRVEWGFASTMHDRKTIERLAEDHVDALRALIEHCRFAEGQELTPSDFPLAELDSDELGRLAALIEKEE